MHKITSLTLEYLSLSFHMVYMIYMIKNFNFLEERLFCLVKLFWGAALR